MWEIIVLGIIPGTGVQITFRDILLTMLICALSTWGYSLARRYVLQRHAQHLAYDFLTIRPF